LASSPAPEAAHLEKTGLSTMREATAQCIDCGATIPQRTADDYDGRCVPCWRKATATPPPGYELPADLAERLAALDQDAAQLRAWAWQAGADSVRWYVGKLEEASRVQREWAPRLRTFAARCRQERPPPREDSLSVRDRAKQQIYAAKLATPQLGQAKTVALCSMPLVAIPVAQALWPQDDDRIVILTPEERERWQAMYQHPADSLAWFSTFWWDIDDAPERQRRLTEGTTLVRWNEGDVPSGERPWLVTVGQAHDPLYGWGQEELWSWNGSRAKFIAITKDWIS
jgi:hypothetical protein